MNLALLVGIFPYILKLLTGQGSDDSKHILVSIWASIIGFDISCRDQLVKEKSQTHFIQFLSSADMSIQHRTMAAFVLAEICNEYRYKLVSSFFCEDTYVYEHMYFTLCCLGMDSKPVWRWGCIGFARALSPSFNSSLCIRVKKTDYCTQRAGNLTMAALVCSRYGCVCA